ncbi:MAG TPA: hypothetical protein VIJ88_01835 [Candidatus Paceibacterota bacterium]
MSIHKKVGFENDTALALLVAVMWTLGIVVLPRLGIAPGAMPDIVQQSLNCVYLLLHVVVFVAAFISAMRWFKRGDYKKSSKRSFAVLQLLLYLYVFACIIFSLYVTLT